MLFSSILTEDTAFRLLGVTSGYNPPYLAKITISKIDSSGVFNKYLAIDDNLGKGFGAFGNSLIKTKNGKYAFAGYSNDALPRAVFGKFDPLLDSVEIFEYQTPFSFALHGHLLLEYDSGVFFIAGVRTDSASLRSNVMLIKVTENGNRIWEKYYGLADKAEGATGFTKLSNGNLMIGSGINDLNRTKEHSHTWLLEVDTGGKLVRQWYDPNDSTYSAHGLLQTQDGGIVYLAQKKTEQTVNDIYYTATVVKMDSLFGKQWTYTGGYPTQFTGLYDIEKTPDNSLLACGQDAFYNGDSSILAGWIVKLSENGDVKWSRKYTGSTISQTWCWLYDLDVLDDGNIVACGECFIPDQGQVGWLLVLDSNGCEIENCINNIPFPQNEESIKLFPNPTSNKIFLTQASGERITDISVFDIEGREVNKKTFFSQQPVELEVHDLPNGMYLLQIKNEEGKMQVKKFIVNKE